MKYFLLLLLLIPAAAFPQYRNLGADDEATGRSSGAWHQSSSAIFSNPAGLAHIVQAEGTITNDRVFHTSYAGGAFFNPSIGTLAIGAYHDTSSAGTGDVLSIGYARDLLSSIDLGISVGGRKQDLTITPVLGAGFIFRPEYGSVLRDLSLGAYLQNITFNDDRNKPTGSIGAAYWFLNGRVRAQASYTVNDHLGTVQTGVEAHVLDWLFARTGTERWKSLSAGIGISLSYLRIDATAGKSMFLLTFTPRLGTAWYENRNMHFQEGVRLYEQQRYPQAVEEFEWALKYDRNYSPAREYRSAAQSAYRMKVEEYFDRGKVLLLKKQYRDAIQMFEAALAINPGHDSSRIELGTTEEMLRGLVDTAVATGERYLNQRQYRQARAMFQKALEYDSTDAPVREAITEVDSTRAAAVDSLFRAGDSAVRQSLLETGRRIFQLALSMDPGNPAITRRLDAIKEKVTVRELISEGKKQLAQGEPQNALRAFRSALEIDTANDEAKKYVSRCLAVLKDVIEGLFHQGLRAYANEEYETAIDLFSQVVAIEPTHRAAMEYLERANEKLRALEQLQ